MLDQATLKGRIVAAALRLAAERPWSAVTLLDIAESAGTDLAAMREHFASKSEIVSAFARQIDDEVLKAAHRPAEGQAPRDALFEVVMSRFDALAPYKASIRSIVADSGLDPALVARLLSSQAWMLNAAGIGTDGLEGGLKVAGLAGVYSSVLRTWLDDDDPGLARTMAALDRRLRRGERALDGLGGVLSAVRRMTELIRGGQGKGAGARPTSSESEPASPQPEPQANHTTH